MEQVTKVLFYFPWREVSGGPIYLCTLASELAKDPNYEVYYADFDPGLSDDLITNKKIKKVIVSESCFDVFIDSPVLLVTPIYFANWIPSSLHPDSRIIFFNWHACSMDTLRTNWPISERNMDDFLEAVHETRSIFFLDQSHWLHQNTKTVEFEKTIVPISLHPKGKHAKQEIVKEGEINIGVLGRLCADKIHSVTNLLRNVQKAATRLPVTVHIIGDGPDKDKIDATAYRGVTVNLLGTVTGKDLDHILTSEIDVLFGMGTSVLEGGARKLPSVVIPHSMKPMTCDQYVYLQDSPGFCLGWLDTQVNELSLRPKSLASILKDLYENRSKKELGEKALEHVVQNHTLHTAVSALKEALDSTTLTYRYLLERSSRYQIFAKKYALIGTDILTFVRQPNGRLKGKLFNKFAVLSAENRGEAGKWTLYFLGVPLINITRSSTHHKIRPYMPPLPSPIIRGLSRIVTDSMLSLTLDRQSHLENHLNQIQSRIAEVEYQLRKLDYGLSGNASTYDEYLASFLEDRLSEPEKVACPRRIQIDTCDKFLTEESMKKFSGNIYSDYQNLVRGLDDESVLVVGRILSRLQKYRRERTSYFTFTEDEQKELSKIYDAHNSQFLRLSDDYYAYGRYILPTNIITTTVFYYEHFLKSNVRLDHIQNRHIIDAGGSFGDSALVLAKYTNKKIHVFEPTSEMFQLAEKTIDLNGLKNVSLIKKALGDARSETEIQLRKDFSRISNSRDFSGKSEKISVITLDDYVQENQIDVGLIKVDVEGHEMALLKGAEETIRSQKPTLLLSIYHSAEDFFGIKPLIESWGLDYQFQIKKPSDNSIIVDTTLIAQVEKH